MIGYPHPKPGQHVAYLCAEVSRPWTKVYRKRAIWMRSKDRSGEGGTPSSEGPSSLWMPAAWPQRLVSVRLALPSLALLEALWLVPLSLLPD